LGRQLGCGAYLQALQRLRVGPFSLDQAVSLPAKSPDPSASELLEHLIPLAECLPHLPTVKVDHDSAEQVRQGKSLIPDSRVNLECGISPGEHVKIVCGPTLVAVAVLGDRPERIQPVRVFNSELSPDK
jgi:tRNA pseudouridine55 synthase